MTIRLLSRAQVAALLSPADCIEAVAQAFIAHAQGQSLAPQAIHGEAPSGDFHIKVGGLPLSQLWYAVKAGSVFPENPKRRALPTIQGALLLFDAESGTPVALMDAMALTGLRTGAATALAVRRLARPDAEIATLVGCGVQGRAQLRCLAVVRPDLRQALAFDTDFSRAEQLASELSAELPFPVRAVSDLAAAVSVSEIVITATTARAPFLKREWVKPGTLISAVGADSPAKQELEAAVLADAAIFTDLSAQCARVGELHHALDAGLVRLDQVRAELGQVLAGQRPGRRNPNEIIVFDATGTALQDVAAAVTVYQRAELEGVGLQVEL